MKPDSDIPVFAGESANDVYCLAAAALLGPKALVQPSRAGSTRELLHAVLSIEDPRQRWVSSRVPAMNPAFALAEVVWILTGRNDAAFLTFFNSQLPKFVGDRTELSGAYGSRLRSAFGFDQLARGYEALSSNPETRQVVLQIWGAEHDFPKADGVPAHSDIPCNVASILKVRAGRLHWTQILRSNDLVLGFPHNVVQFTSLQEIVAGWLGLQVGSYVHLSDSLHVYSEHWSYLKDLPASKTLSVSPSLALPYKESALVLRDLETCIERMLDVSTGERELDRMLTSTTLPSPYHSWLAVFVAEAARRKGYGELALAALEECADHTLRGLLRAWFIRVEKRELAGRS